MSLLSSFLPRGLIPMTGIPIAYTTTFSVVQDTYVLLVVIGGGGSGGVVFDGNLTPGIGTTPWKCMAQGGNAGDICFQLARLKAGNSYLLVRGNGGVPVGADDPSASLGGSIAGNDGGNTGFLDLTESLINITAAGGKGGQAWDEEASIGGTNDRLEWQDNAGPTAGAELWFRGGRGGKINDAQQNIWANKSFALATGGGAVNLNGNANLWVTAGDIIYDIADGARLDEFTAATGGAGVGGRGGSITLQNQSGTNYFEAKAISSGGGTASHAENVLAVIDAHDLAFAEYVQTPDANDQIGGFRQGRANISMATLLNPRGEGGISQLVTDDGDLNYWDEERAAQQAGDGAGGAGCTVSSGFSSSTQNTLYGNPGGMFAGGGAVVGGYAVGDKQWNTIYGGDGGFLGGGGGGACGLPEFSNGDNYTAWSGKGGDGGMIIFQLTDFSRVIA